MKPRRTREVKQEYEKAIELYKKYERVTGESAKFHIEGVQKKLSDL